MLLQYVPGLVSFCMRSVISLNSTITEICCVFFFFFLLFTLDKMDRFFTKTSSKNISGPIPTISSSEGDISVDIATVSSSANARSETVGSRSQNPWPYLQEFFEFVSSNEGDRMVFKCIN